MDRDANTTRKDIGTDIPQDFHHEDADNFENVKYENPTSLAAITRELDDLCHQVHAGEGQPVEALHHLQCELQRLSIALCPSAPLEPLNYVLKHIHTPYVLPNSRHTLQTP